jgi:TolB-like protein/Tfp pilus assembly protein PilF
VRRHDFSGRSTEATGNVADREVRAQLDRILHSRAFRNSERLQRFLKFAVECALEGTVDRLKESLLGRFVFDRGSKYDPRTDSIVRVESQRLRKKLREYYEVEGRADPVSIVFKAGSYVPTFVYLTSVYDRRRQTPGEEPEARLLNRQTVAVLPLSNLSADPEQEYFCDGITDDIIYALSRIPGLNVIGHTSVFALKGAAEDTREIGTRLAAGTIVDGSIRKSGNRLKIFAEILDVASGEIRWAETYARTLDGLFTLEEEIAQAVARALQMTLASSASSWVTRGAPNMGAYLLYLQGRYTWNRMSADGYQTAAEIFERAISLFPEYAQPYAGLADAYLYLALWGHERPCEVLPKAQRSALQALNLNSFLPHAHSALAAATALYEWKWEEGEGLARRAIELEPSYSFGQQIYGWCLLARGESDQAVACFERSVALDPLSARAHRTLGWALHIQRQPSNAEKWIEAALVLDREPVETRYLLAQVYLSDRRFEAALEQARQCQTDPPYPLSLGVLGACLACLDHRNEALEILAKLSRLAEAGYVDPNALAQVQIALNDTDSAITSVGRILDERVPFAFFIKLDPEFDPLRPDARFSDLVLRLGI